MSIIEIIEINDIDNWIKIVEKSSVPAIVMFYSPNCQHCQAMEPYFRSYAQEFQGKVNFVKVNIIDNTLIAEKHGVFGTPTFKLFCRGYPIQDYVGEIYPSVIKKNDRRWVAK